MQEQHGEHVPADAAGSLPDPGDRCVRRPLPAPTLVPGGLPGGKLRRVADHIDANLGGALRLGELSGVVHMSPFHFARLSKRTAGVPPHRFVVRRRVDRTIELLAGGEHPMDGGVIVLTGSIADIKGFPAMSVYGATKATVRSFARTWTNELRDRHIRVNIVSPGHIDTPSMESLQQGDALTRMKEEFARAVPLGRMGDPDEIAKAVSFLASDKASYVSGIELFVDGGVAQI
jgi:NAD(P)-dependent dehydrogenase (short-subunit alcohol dehydrogenase family)